MAWNGNGTFSRIYSWAADANAGIDILASRMDTDTDNITNSGFNNCVTRDGQGSATANLPMNTFIFTGLGPGANPTDSVNFSQLSGILTTPTLSGPNNSVCATVATTGSGGYGVLSLNVAAGQVASLKFDNTSGANTLTLGTSGGAVIMAPDGSEAARFSDASNGEVARLTTGSNGTFGLLNFNAPAGVVGSLKWDNTGGANYMTLATQAGAFTIDPAGTETARFANDGSFLVGSLTNAGAGYIAATGNIIAFYSDMRLKTKLGRIINATKKLMSLDVFYYEPNELARKLGYKKERRAGISAQSMLKAFPEAITEAPINGALKAKGVRKPKTPYMTIEQDEVIPLLIATIQEQENRIAAMEKRLKG